MSCSFGVKSPVFDRNISDEEPVDSTLCEDFVCSFSLSSDKNELFVEDDTTKRVDMMDCSTDDSSEHLRSSQCSSSIGNEELYLYIPAKMADMFSDADEDDYLMYNVSEQIVNNMKTKHMTSRPPRGKRGKKVRFYPFVAESASVIKQPFSGIQKADAKKTRSILKTSANYIPKK